jgi:hypothetical protein
MTPPAPPTSLLDPTLLAALGLVLGTALKTLFDYAVKRWRPSEDPNHEGLRTELLAEAEALRKELRNETRALKAEVEQLRQEVDRWKVRYYRLFALLRDCPEVRDQVTAEVDRLAQELS